jgi:hypothetical protein
MNEEYSEDIKQLVIARLDVMSSKYGFAIGGGMFSKAELIEHVRAGDEIGKTMVRIHLEYIRALVDGSLLKELTALPE